MDQKIQALSDWGCDIKSAMERALDDEDFYLSCCNEIPGDPCFEQLKTSLANKDVKAAFEAAHSLKGVLANFGITPMYNKVVEIVEPLRKGDGEGLDGKVEELLVLNEHLKEILGL